MSMVRRQCDIPVFFSIIYGVLSIYGEFSARTTYQCMYNNDNDWRYSVETFSFSCVSLTVATSELERESMNGLTRISSHTHTHTHTWRIDVVKAKKTTTLLYTAPVLDPYHHRHRVKCPRGIYTYRGRIYIYIQNRLIVRSEVRACKGATIGREKRKLRVYIFIYRGCCSEQPKEEEEAGAQPTLIKKCRHGGKSRCCSE